MRFPNGGPSGPFGLGGPPPGLPAGAGLQIGVNGGGGSVIENPTGWEEVWRPDTPTYAYGSAYSPELDVLAVGGNVRSDNIWIYDGTQEFATIGRLTDATESIPTLAFSPDGAYLAAGTREPSVRVYDTADWSLVAATPTPRDILRITYSPDGSHIAAGSEEDQLYIIDAAAGYELLHTLDASRSFGVEVLALAYRPDGSELFASGWDGSHGPRYGYDVANGYARTDYNRYTNSARDARFHPDGSELALAYRDTLLRLDPHDGYSKLDADNSLSSGASTAVAYNESTTRLAVGTNWGYVRIYDTADLTDLQTFSLNAAVNGLGWTPENWLVVTTTGVVSVFKPTE